MEFRRGLQDWLFEQLYVDDEGCLSELVETGRKEFTTPAGFKFVATLKFEKA